MYYPPPFKRTESHVAQTSLELAHSGSRHRRSIFLILHFVLVEIKYCYGSTGWPSTCDSLLAFASQCWGASPASASQCWGTTVYFGLDFSFFFDNGGYTQGCAPSYFPSYILSP